VVFAQGTFANKIAQAPNLYFYCKMRDLMANRRFYMQFLWPDFVYSICKHGSASSPNYSFEKA
jgi:hypothetical protein